MKQIVIGICNNKKLKKRDWQSEKERGDMPKIKMEIEEFDKLSITDLMQAKDKELMIAIFMKVKQINGKVRFHDWFIKAILTTMGLGIMSAIIVGIINFAF